jgi:hypothetical protein
VATYKVRTRNSDEDEWTDRFEVDDPLGLLDLTGLTAPIATKLIADGEAQIECLVGTTRKYLIKTL